MADLREEIRILRDKAAQGEGLESLLRGIAQALKNHPDECANISASYRFQASDTGVGLAFRMDKGAYAPIGDGEAATVTVTGTQDNLMKLIRGELNPVKALLLGRVKIQGNKDALMALAAFL